MNKNASVEGTGLGMAITKGLVELMNGEIDVRSEYGKGSIFTVEIDQTISDKKVEEIADQEPIGIVEPFNASGQKVLVVDDNKINLKVAERLLREYNLSIELVLSGSECINKILDGKKYDLIFLDIMMPKMKGPEVLKNLKNIIGFKTPVVALTADVISGMEEKYISQGFDECLAKPIVEEELYKILKRYLKENKSNTKPITTEELNKNEKHNLKLLEKQGVNVKQGLELLKDIDMYELTLTEFYEELEEKLNNLNEYKNNKDLDSYSILAHSLKTEARYLGFNDFADMAYDHELAAKENNQEFVDKNYPELKMEAIKNYDIIKTYLGDKK
jgi:CheY-like chemotaxis protein/HPt (histidine-containing phosphotransfer) domain-containing protein